MQIINYLNFTKDCINRRIYNLFNYSKPMNDLAYKELDKLLTKLNDINRRINNEFL